MAAPLLAAAIPAMATLTSGLMGQKAMAEEGRRKRKFDAMGKQADIAGQQVQREQSALANLMGAYKSALMG